MISSYNDLIQASHSQQEPQRLLFVFCRAELPDEASPEERAAFERGEGGALTPVICVDKTPEEAPDFGALQEESRGHRPVLGCGVRRRHVWPRWHAPIHR